MKISIVNRVSIFFLAALAVCLIGFSSLSYVLIRNHLYDQFDHVLQNALNVLAAAIEVEDDGVKWQPTDHAISLGGATEVDDVRWVIADGSGRVVDRSRNLAAVPDDLAAILRTAQAEKANAHQGDWRYLQTQLTAPRPKSVSDRDSDEFDTVLVTVARSTRQIHGDLTRLALLLASGPMALWLIAAIVGRRYCRAALQPLVDMAATARSMNQADFDLRLDEGLRRDELSDLAVAFNGLLDQLRRAFEQQRRFTGDAAHQLRTPLTVLRGQIDVALRRPREGDDYRSVLLTLRDQTQELQQLVESLLFLARTDAQSSLPETENLELPRWLTEQRERWKTLPRRDDISVSVETSQAISAPPALLSQVIDNLVSNAAKYSSPGTPIVVRATSHNGMVSICVEDNGMGVAAEDRPYVFDPFFRTTAARQSGTEGSGLGLALVSRVATALGGSVECTSNQPCGSCFIVRLPATSMAQQAVTRQP